MKDASLILTEALSERAANNPRYSLRAFARDLGISPQLLSNVINGRRGLGSESARKIAKLLDLDEHGATIFVESFKSKFARSSAQRIVAQHKLKSMERSGISRSLELDLFKVISNWYHFALIELIKISKSRKNKIRWYAEKLGIPQTEVENALRRLESLDLISRVGNGWQVKQDVVIADKGVSPESVRNFHKQILERSIQALSMQTSAERYGSSSTVPIRLKDVEKAKRLIQDFRISFDDQISRPEDGENIYALSLQFFRLTNLDHDQGVIK